jgi:hypothetical protein
MVFGIIPECRSASFRNKRSGSSESPPAPCRNGPQLNEILPENLKLFALLRQNFQSMLATSY